MSRIFLWLAGALLVGSVVLGWLNSNRIGAVQQEKEQALADAGAARIQADKTRRDLTTTKTQLETANSAATDAKNQLATAAAEAARLRSETEANQARLTAALDEATALRNRPPATDSTRSTTNVNDEAAQKIRELETRLEEYAMVKKTLDDQLRLADASVRQYQRSEQQRQMRVMRNGLTGSVLAVDRNWNFVVLDLGDRNGVINNAEMIVARGGAMIGKVRITSVEPSQSIADIVPNSVPPGTTVQRGDRVIFAGDGG